MRVLAVAQVLDLFVHQRQRGGKRRGVFAFTPQQVIRHHGVVLGRVRECLGRKTRARVDAGGAVVGVELAQNLRVVGRIDDHGHRVMVLGRGAHHGRPTDVDVFDGIRVGAVGLGHGLRERVEIHDQQVDGRDVVLCHDGVVDAATAQEAAVHARVQGLDPPVHDLGKAGIGADVDYRETRVPQGARGAAGAEQLDLACGQRTGEINQPRLVGDRQQGPANRDEHYGLFGRDCSAGEAELAQLLAQRAPVDAEDRSGAALVAGGIVEHGAEQRFFHFAQHEVVQVRRLVAVQVGEVIGECSLGVVTQGHFKRAIATGIFSGP